MSIDSKYKNYVKSAEQPMRPYIVGEDMTGVSVSDEDVLEEGGMIGINPKNIAERWYIAKDFFEANYKLASDALGKAICVLDKGFVYIGTLFIDDKMATIEDAQCIRKWGTTKGLGQLALEGPQSKTVLDKTGTVVCLKEELKHAILTDASLWA